MGCCIFRVKRNACPQQEKNHRKTEVKGECFHPEIIHLSGKLLVCDQTMTKVKELGIIFNLCGHIATAKQDKGPHTG